MDIDVVSYTVDIDLIYRPLIPNIVNHLYAEALLELGMTEENYKEAV